MLSVHKKKSIKKKNKIMFYINTVGNKGGAERVMSQLANRFCDAGYEVVFVTSYRKAEERILAEGVNRLSLENEEIMQSRLKRNVSRIAKLRKLCKREKPQVLVSFMQEPNFRALIATLGLPIKTIVSVRNDPNREYAGIAGKIVGKLLLPMADGCVFQTEEAQAWFPKRLQEKSKIIFNAVTESFFETKREHPENVVTAGRLVKAKNHSMLIRAFAKVAEKYPEEKLLIYGAGRDKEELESLIEDLKMDSRVMLMGVTEQMQDVLARAKVFVLSSDYEGMPNALMEALAVGVPSISTDCPCGGPKMLIEHEKNGLLVPVNDENAMAEAMERLLGDPAFAEKLGSAAREKAESYKPNKVFHEWRTFVENIVYKE